jgi:hypothetical protein
MPGVAEVALTIVLVCGIWSAGALFIGVADRVELKREARARRRRSQRSALTTR